MLAQTRTTRFGGQSDLTTLLLGALLGVVALGGMTGSAKAGESRPYFGAIAVERSDGTYGFAFNYRPRGRPRPDRCASVGSAATPASAAASSGSATASAPWPCVGEAMDRSAASAGPSAATSSGAQSQPRLEVLRALDHARQVHQLVSSLLVHLHGGPLTLPARRL